MFDMEAQNQIEMTFRLWGLSEAVCHHVLQEENVQKLIHSTDLHFDLIIIEAFFNECFLGFAHKFKAPLIQVCTYGGSNFMADWVGSPNPYSYVPDEFIDYTDKMNFWQRMYNSVFGTLKHVGRQLIHLPRQNAALHKYFNYTDNLPPVWELEYKTSLVLLNTHHSLSYPKPLMPNYVQVGGMHVKPPKKLPQVRNVKLIFLICVRSIKCVCFVLSVRLVLHVYRLIVKGRIFGRQAVVCCVFRHLPKVFFKIFVTCYS